MGRVTDANVVQTEVAGDGPAQARDTRRIQAHQGEREIDQPLAFWQAAQHVQAVTDLQIAELAEIAVDVLDELAIGFPLRLYLDTQIAVQLGAHHEIPDRLHDQREL